MEESAMPRTIAIDGPVGAGKTTIAKNLAESLGIQYLDTGAMYRAVALKAIREKISPYDADAVRHMLQKTEVSVRWKNGSQHTLLDGEDISERIRTPEISKAGSAVSTHAFVREKMVALQRECARRTDMVLDGRDIGTRVLPGAAFKFFLNASPEMRAKRRYEELTARGVDCDYQQIYDDLMARDLQDTRRAVDPLRRAEDAIEIDTTDLDLSGVLRKLLSVIEPDTDRGNA